MSKPVTRSATKKARAIAHDQNNPSPVSDVSPVIAFE